MKKLSTNLLSLTILVAGMQTSLCAAEVPWLETFDTPESFSGFTTIDGNGDKEEWYYNSHDKCARISYNDDLDMDDWLVTPGFQLTKGAVYKFSIDARNYMGAERFEVFAGMGNRVVDMTVGVIKATDVNAMKYVTYSGEFTATESGEWFIGIHGCSPAGRLYLDVDNLSLNYGVSAASPEALSEFTVTPDADGMPNVSIAGVLPITDTEGKRLASIDKVEVVCDNDVVYTSEPLVPGERFSWIHKNAPLQRHTYRVVAYNGNARGREAVAEVFVGPNVPGSVRFPQVGELVPGEVTLRWQCPDKDVDGNPLNPALVKYKVVRFEIMDNSTFIEEDIEGADELTQTEFVHKAIAPGQGQAYTAYGVYAYTSAGKSKRVDTPLFPVGDTYETPWRESFDGGAAVSLFRSETVKNYQVVPSWDVFNDTDSDVKARDNDFGYMAMNGEHADDCARFYSGKVSLAGLSRPALSFYAYNYTAGTSVDRNELEVYVCVAPPFLFQKEIIVGELPAKGWNKVIVPLDEFAGKTIQFAFQGTTKTHMATPVDCITIDNLADVDLEAVEVNAPATVSAGRGFNVVAKIENGGSLKADGYKVELYRDNVLVGVEDGPAIESCGIAEVVFNDCISVFSTGNVSYHAVVVCDKDAVPDNNESGERTVAVEAPVHPAPLRLNGNTSGSVVTLGWETPDLSSAVSEAVTESFEDYVSFASSGVGDWIFVDADGAKTGKLQDISIPGVHDNPEGAVTSFWVMDADYEGLNGSFAARSGSKYIAQMFNAGGVACDDWAITPELYGEGQEVSFYAKSYSSYSSQAETFEVYYSEGGVAISDFKLIEKIDAVPNVWTCYKWTLKPGARRFAIRCTSVDKYMLMVDDVTYIPANGSVALQLEGYNVYRNGVKLNDVPVTEAAYIDESVPDGTHTYAVTALYDKGESLPTDGYVAAVSGLETVMGGTSVAVYGDICKIVVAGAAGMDVTVLTPDGKIVDAFRATDMNRVGVAAGVYVVRVGTGVFKVHVK